MARTSVSYVCQQCGSAFPKWAGKCDDCGAWNMLVEERRGASAGPGKRTVGRQIAMESLQSAQTVATLVRM
ncbi:MAG: DNA repair protein RadA, partial [Pseudomonadota bacterium]|nr:DNA repair protein RadA [Pseudomonadota bacterium]